MVRPVKKARNSEMTEVDKGVNFERNNIGMSGQGALERRVLRSRYLAVKNLISNERDDISRHNSEKFKSIISEVDALHENVKKPREQVTDAETLLDIATTLAISVRSQNNEGVSPSDFVTAILHSFGYQQQSLQVNNSQSTVSWENIGLSVSDIFKSVPGCCTMIGPMSSEMKQRKVAVHKKRTRPTESTLPEEVEGKEETKTDTDSNMLTMFEILKKKRRVRLDCLLLNRLSFAQTVENIFALSFLVKDGRAEITVDDEGCHFVSPRNAPAASLVASGAVSYHHFVFRFDFKDWKSMMLTVGRGEELMPHRSPLHDATTSTSTEQRSTPIRKLTRNRGLITVEEDSMVEDSVEKEQIPSRKAIAGKNLRF